MVKIAFNPYPARYRLPGDLTPARQQLAPIEGKVRRVFVHALTFHELPADIDGKLDRFPRENELMALDPLEKHYLSFTAYSLKQMVAAGTLSADTAWGLFDREWQKLGSVDEAYLKYQARTDFLQQVGKLLGRTRFTSGRELLKFEFCSRAGRAGLAQFAKFGEWASKLVFDGENSRYLSKPFREEYAKALWLEMRSIEGQVGIAGLNQDVKTFGYEADGGSYFSQDIKITGNVNPYDFKRPERSIDTIIKAEAGHWLFGMFNLRWAGLRHPEAQCWISELMHRMNHIGFTPRIKDSAEAGTGAPIPPEAETFFSGGQSSLVGEFEAIRIDSGLPLYPFKYPYQDIAAAAQMVGCGEFIWDLLESDHSEYVVRQRVVRAFREGALPGREIYNTYRKMGVYIALAHLEADTQEEIFDRIERFDLKEIDKYYRSYRKRAINALDAGRRAVRLDHARIDDAVLDRSIETISKSRLIGRRRPA